VQKLMPCNFLDKAYFFMYKIIIKIVRVIKKYILMIIIIVLIIIIYWMYISMNQNLEKFDTVNMCSEKKNIKDCSNATLSDLTPCVWCSDGSNNENAGNCWVQSYIDKQNKICKQFNSVTKNKSAPIKTSTTPIKLQLPPIKNPSPPIKNPSPPIKNPSPLIKPQPVIIKKLSPVEECRDIYDRCSGAKISEINKIDNIDSDRLSKDDKRKNELRKRILQNEVASNCYKPYQGCLRSVKNYIQ